MASIKVKYRPSTIADHEGAIYYQIIHERKVRQLNTEYHVMPDEWDENRSMVTTKQSSERKSFILSIRERIRWDVERLTKIDKRLDAEGLSYTADDVIDELQISKSRIGEAPAQAFRNSVFSPLSFSGNAVGGRAASGKRR